MRKQESIFDINNVRVLDRATTTKCCGPAASGVSVPAQSATDAAEVEDWTCWRRLLGIDEGPRCAINTEGLIEMIKILTEIFFPPLVAGIALLAVAWIVAGFQRRA